MVKRNLRRAIQRQSATHNQHLAISDWQSDIPTSANVRSGDRSVQEPILGRKPVPRVPCKLALSREQKDSIRDTPKDCLAVFHLHSREYRALLQMLR